MSEEWETKGQQVARAKTGLQILYARCEAGDQPGDLAERDVPGELRERYWIRRAEDAGIKGRTTGLSFTISIPRWIERHELGRNRNEPGDGFRYVFRTGTSGTESRAEWFEVTEVFEGVKGKDVEAFMRVNNGGTAGFDFDPDRFVTGLEMGTPGRAAQRRAADKVIAAVEKKMSKASYEGMWRQHGYGTLIVGLPLWFATLAADPLRAENVIDDFNTRVKIGLKPCARQLKKKSCPFWRIVVVWVLSRESAREWYDKARYEVYDDPAHGRIGGLPITRDSMMLGLLEFIGDEAARADGEKAEEWTLYIPVASPKKQGEVASLQLPPDAKALKRNVEDHGERIHRENLLDRVKWHAMQRAIEVLCFLQAYGVAGLERWAIAKLSPRQGIKQLAIERRALRLYRASRRRQPMKGRTSDLGIGESR